MYVSHGQATCNQRMTHDNLLRIVLNNSSKMLPGTANGAASWHSADPLHCLHVTHLVAPTDTPLSLWGRVLAQPRKNIFFTFAPWVPRVNVTRTSLLTPYLSRTTHQQGCSAQETPGESLQPLPCLLFLLSSPPSPPCTTHTTGS